MLSIGLIGGTGDLGTALALHLSRKCEKVVIGSRSEAKARATVERILEEKGARNYLVSNLKPASNSEAVSDCEIVIATVPHEIALETLSSLSSRFKDGQLLISAIAVMSKIGTEFFPGAGNESIALGIKSLLPKGVKVASAFQTVPASMLYKEKALSADVLVASEDYESFEKVAELVSSIEGLRPLYLGGLELSAELERLTALLLNVALKNKLKSPTIKINSF